MVKRPAPRREVLEILKLGGSMTAAQIAERFGSGVSAVRPHLERLVADDLVAIDVVRGGPGRPSYRYKLTKRAQDAFPDDYRSLAMDLFDGMAEVGGEDLLQEVFRVREESLYNDFKPRVTSPTMEGKLLEISEVMSEKGYMASIQKEGPEFVLTARHCPVSAVSDHSSVPCKCEQRLLTRLLGVDVRREHTGPDRGDYHTCTYRISGET